MECAAPVMQNTNCPVCQKNRLILNPSQDEEINVYGIKRYLLHHRQDISNRHPFYKRHPFRYYITLFHLIRKPFCSSFDKYDMHPEMY